MIARCGRCGSRGGCCSPLPQIMRSSVVGRDLQTRAPGGRNRCRRSYCHRIGLCRRVPVSVQRLKVEPFLSNQQTTNRFNRLSMFHWCSPLAENTIPNGEVFPEGYQIARSNDHAGTTEGRCVWVTSSPSWVTNFLLARMPEVSVRRGHSPRLLNHPGIFFGLQMQCSADEFV